jgi:hypothetical protein
MKFPVLLFAVIIAISQVALVPKAHAGRGSRAIVGGLIGAAIGAAIYHHSQKNKRRKGRQRRSSSRHVNSDVYPRQLGNWNINFDRENLICLASSESGNGTYYHIGQNGKDGDWFFSYTNPQWKSIKEGQPYNVDYVFDRRKSWDGESTGIDSGLLLDGLADEFVTDFARSNKLSIHFNGKQIDLISLRGTRNATNAIKHCYKGVLALQQKESINNNIAKYLNKSPAAAPGTAPAVDTGREPAADNTARPPYQAAQTYTSAPAERTPQTVGECTTTHVEHVGTRLHESADSGTAIRFTNDIQLVAYEAVEAADTSVKGDEVSICLDYIPDNCPPGDERGKVYSVKNMRTHESFTMPDAAHACGGA